MTELRYHMETATGRGGLAIIVLSGDGAEALVTRAARREGLGPLAKAGRLGLWTLGDEGSVIDEVLVARLPGADPVFEIGIHGGPAVVAEVCALLEELGAVESEPRAVLAASDDSLSRAALERLPKARGEMAARLLLFAINGELQRLVESIAADLEGQGEALRALIESGEWGPLFFDVPTVALVGAPNAGKSTLFNALLGESRAITSQIPGTTRDYLEEWASFQGLPVNLVDTAGLRVTADAIESEGIDLGRGAAREAALRLLLIDGLEGPDKWPEAVASPWILVVNKIDGVGDLNLEALKEKVLARYGRECPAIFVSALTGRGLDELAAGARRLLAPTAPLDIREPGLFCESQREALRGVWEDLEAGETERARKRLRRLLD